MSGLTTLMVSYRDERIAALGRLRQVSSPEIY